MAYCTWYNYVSLGRMTVASTMKRDPKQVCMLHGWSSVH